MKIVLANPPTTQDREADLTSYPNLGILSLVAYARKHLQDIEFHYLEPLPIDDYADEIEKLKPDIFGISFAVFMHHQSYEAMRRVRRRLPHLPIICGGPHPTALPEEVMTNSPADVCVIGEGEQTFVELIRHFQRPDGNSLDTIKGIAYRDRQGDIRKTAPREFMDINEIPMMAWDIIDLKEYKGAHISQMKYSTCLLPSRGCPFDCTFCSNPVWKSGKPWLRLRDPKLVAEEVCWLYEKGIREIYIRSDELNANKRWTLELCREIAALGFRDMKFQCNLRADQVDDEIAEAFSSINLWLVYLGIESCNQRVIDGIRKYIDIGKVEDNCRLLQKHGIKVYGFVMLYNAWEENGQLQHETKAEVDNTLREMWKLIRNGNVNYLSWQFATPYPGSHLYRIAEKYNLMEKQVTGVWDVSLHLPGIERRDMIRQRMLGFLLQGYCVVRSGNINWAVWKRFFNKIIYVLESGWEILGYSKSN